MAHHLGAELHMGSDIHHPDEHDFSRDMGGSLGFSPSPDRPIRRGNYLHKSSLKQL